MSPRLSESSICAIIFLEWPTCVRKTNPTTLISIALIVFPLSFVTAALIKLILGLPAPDFHISLALGEIAE